MSTTRNAAADTALRRAQTRVATLEQELRTVKDAKATLKDSLRGARIEMQARIQSLEQSLHAALDANSKLKERIRGLAIETEAPLFREHRQRWLQTVNEPLLLVSQIPRSGGTLLSQLLDGHPECHGFPYELKWGKKWYWPALDINADEYTLFNALDQNWLMKTAKTGVYTKNKFDPPAHASGGDAVTHRNERRDGYPFIFDRTLQHRVFKSLIDKNPPSNQRQILNAYLTGFFNAWLDYQGLYTLPKRFVSAFSPRVNMEQDSLRQFMCDYSDGFLLSIVRHPAAWHTSAARSTAARKKDPRNADVDLWSASTLSSLAAKEQYGE